MASQAGIELLSGQAALPLTQAKPNNLLIPNRKKSPFPLRLNRRPAAYWTRGRQTDSGAEDRLPTYNEGESVIAKLYKVSDHRCQ